MGNGWHEWPLVLFTVLGQSVAGAIIVSGLGWLSLNNNSEARQRLVRCMFFIWLVMGIGFLASIIHLGSPLRAFNSLTRVGASALSNEIASGALFFAVGGVWWLLTFLGKMPAIPPRPGFCSPCCSAACSSGDDHWSIKLIPCRPGIMPTPPPPSS